MRLPAALSPLFPPAAAPADEAALDQHLDDTALFYGRGCALTLNLLHLLFWPTDRWLLPHDPAVYWTMCWFRAGTFAVHSLYLAALLAPALRRRPLPVLAVAVACSSALFGAAMAQMGGLDRPYFYLTYLAPMGIGAVPARPLRRLLLSPACGLVLCLAYFAARPSELGSVRFGAAVGCMAFVLVVSQIIGHGMFLLARRAFLMGRALDRSRSMLKEYSEHLEDKMADHALQLRRLAAYREHAANATAQRIAHTIGILKKGDDRNSAEFQQTIVFHVFCKHHGDIGTCHGRGHLDIHDAGEQRLEPCPRQSRCSDQRDTNQAAILCERRKNSRTTLLGIASASPLAIMVLTPITSPRASASGPPELPGASRTLACTQRCDPRPRTAPTA